MKNELIKNIRQGFEYSEDRSQVLDNLSNSLNILSDDLYNKDFHFLYELIQNAEDNSYLTESPSLSFTVKQINLEGNEEIGLIISNNEVGFSEENIRAICAIGRSTKDISNDSIGEKGIGFKSVFKITNYPYIFSNNYAFKLPEINPENPENGLGYIVPYEVKTIPEYIKKGQTTIILPINKNIKVEKVVEELLDLNENTILFLNKIPT